MIIKFKVGGIVDHRCELKFTRMSTQAYKAAPPQTLIKCSKVTNNCHEINNGLLTLHSRKAKAHGP